MSKILIIFNPLAGLQYPPNYRACFIKQASSYLPNVVFDWLETQPDINQQLADLKFNDYYKIIIIGGDGTVKDVANFLLKNNIELPLAIIPQGSANVLANSLNIPLTEKLAIKTACLGQTKKMDVGYLNQNHYFLVGLSLGYITQVIAKTNRSLKYRYGFWAYFLAFIKHWRIYLTTYDLLINGAPKQVTGNTLIIANALSLYKFKAADKFDLFDGQLELLVLANKTFLGFARVVWTFLFRQKSSQVVMEAKATNIAINLSQGSPVMIQVDGETMTLDKIEVEILPKKLTVVV